MTTNKHCAAMVAFLLSALALFDSGFGQLTDHGWPNPWPDPAPGALNQLEGVHPGYDLATVRPQDFKPQVTGVAFLPDGRLAVLTYPRPNWSNNIADHKGVLYILDGVMGDDPENITVTEFTNKLVGPMALQVVDGEIYVQDRNNLKKITDKDGDGVAEIVALDQLRPGIGHPHTYGLLYRDSLFYSLYGSYNLNAHPGREGLCATGMDGTTKCVSSGLRNCNGLAFGPEGEFFASDDQGEWLPANKLNNVRPDRYYGYGGKNKKVWPPALWLPQGEAAMSPSQPLWVKEGLYAGQMLITDMRMNNIIRAFLERVDGEYQGAAVLFSGGMEAGSNAITLGPDGAFYIGCIGFTTHFTWNWRNKFYGLQRLKANGRKAFEILAVRNLGSRNMEIEFTKPVMDGADQAGKYEITTYWFNPTSAYGGPKQDNHLLNVASLAVSEDGRKVNLEINGLKEGYVVQFNLKDYKSREGDSLWTKRAWYTLNQFGPADALGCMDDGYNEYNPDAVYDDGLQCLTLKIPGCMDSSYTEFNPKANVNIPDSCETLSLNPNRLMRMPVHVELHAAGNTLVVKVPGRHALSIRTVNGRQVFFQTAHGNYTYDFGAIEMHGVYLLKLDAAGKVYHFRAALNMLRPK